MVQVGTMTDPAGRLQIQIAASANGTSVRLGSSRPVAAARLFVGRDAASAVRLLPSLFSVCSVAQSSACAAALEEAAGQPAPHSVQVRRVRLLAAEALREHLWRILLDWPLALGEGPADQAMRDVMGRFGRWRSALTQGGDPLQPHPWRAADEDDGRSAASEAAQREALEGLASLAAAQVLGRAPGAWLAEVGDAEALTAWAARGDTLAARLVRRLLEAGWGGLGRCGVPPLPPPERAVLAARLSGAAADDFVGRPSWAGQVRETSPFTRNLSQPLIAELVGRFGNGLVTRLAAQLVEIARLLADPDSLRESHGMAGEDAVGLPHGVGMGLVPAARGLLVHRLALADDRLVDYRILAPTEWNFHPQGVVASGLAALVDAAGADADWLGRLFVIAVDPCVPFDLSFVG